MALITVDEARELLPAVAAPADETLLASLIDTVESAFARLCGYPPATAGAVPTMASTAYVLEHRGSGGRDLILRVSPATSVSEVYDDPTMDFEDATYLVPASDYAIVREGRTLRLKSTATWGAWGSGESRIRVSFTAGFVTADPMLKHLIRMGVKHLFEERTRAGRLSTTQSGAAQTTAVSYAEVKRMFPPSILDDLAFYFLPNAMGFE